MSGSSEESGGGGGAHSESVVQPELLLDSSVAVPGEAADQLVLADLPAGAAVEAQPQDAPRRLSLPTQEAHLDLADELGADADWRERQVETQLATEPPLVQAAYALQKAAEDGGASAELCRDAALCMEQAAYLKDMVPSEVLNFRTRLQGLALALEESGISLALSAAASQAIGMRRGHRTSEANEAASAPAAPKSASGDQQVSTPAVQPEASGKEQPGSASLDVQRQGFVGRQPSQDFDPHAEAADRRSGAEPQRAGGRERAQMVHPVSAGLGALARGAGAIGAGAGALLETLAAAGGKAPGAIAASIASWRARRADAAAENAIAAGVALSEAMGALEREPAWLQARPALLAAAGGDAARIPEVIAGAVPGGPYEALSDTLATLRADPGYSDGLARVIAQADVYDRESRRGIEQARIAGRPTGELTARLADLDKDVAARSDALPGERAGESLARTIARLVTRLFARLYAFLTGRPSPEAGIGSVAAPTPALGSGAAPAPQSAPAPVPGTTGPVSGAVVPLPHTLALPPDIAAALAEVVQPEDVDAPRPRI